MQQFAGMDVYPVIVTMQMLDKHDPAAKNLWIHRFLCDLCHIKGKLVVSSYQNFLLPIPFHYGALQQAPLWSNVRRILSELGVAPRTYLTRTFLVGTL
jgi:hypothetical protein